ncbi:MAG: M48 family metallopeptidase [Fimbriimonadaceae bacterium]
MSRFLALVGLSLTITVTHADMFKPSKADQVKLGLQAAQEIRKKEKILPATDPRVIVLRRIAEKVLKTVDDSKEPWKYSFDVVDSKEVNAFALPGGPVFFFTGLLNKLKTEDEVAGILGHEITHSRKEHWAYAYADQQKRDLLLAGIMIFGRVGRTAGEVLGLSSEVLLGLPFSRKHESEADRIGFTMMTDAGYNPQGIVDVFEFLKKASSGPKPPEFISTHPDDGRRINSIKDMIAAQNRTYKPMVKLPWDATTYKTARTLRWHW